MIILVIICAILLIEIDCRLGELIKFIKPISDYFHRKRYYEFIIKEEEDE